MENGDGKIFGEADREAVTGMFPNTTYGNFHLIDRQLQCSDTVSPLYCPLKMKER